MTPANSQIKTKTTIPKALFIGFLRRLQHTRRGGGRQFVIFVGTGPGLLSARQL
jgi:hypothetical protein